MSRPVLRFARLAAAIGAVCAFAAGCGSSQKTATIGTSEVTVDGDVDSPIEKIRAIGDREPYEAWALDCIVGHLEKAMTPAEEEELEGGSEQDFVEFLETKGGPAQEACERSGRRLIDPDASAAELDLLRSSQLEAMRVFLEGEGVPDDERECVEGEFAGLSGPELVAYLEAPPAVREGKIDELALPCLRP